MAGLSKGAAGEIQAARFLRNKGFTILSSNYRCRQGEIDIIAQKDNILSFVEVKTRSKNSMYSPREAVNCAKQRRIILTASIYLAKYPSKLQPRFDVIEVVMESPSSLKVSEINHIQGAFDAGDLRSSF